MIYPQLQLDQVHQVKQIADVGSEISFGLSFEHIDFNVKTAGLGDLVVRQAIATAIDRPKLVARTVGQFSSKASILNNRMWVTNQPEYKDTSGGLYDKGDRRGPGTCWSPTVHPGERPRLCQGRRLSFRLSTHLATPCGNTRRP